MRTATRCLQSLLLSLCLCISASYTQWSSDPAVNLSVCDTSGSQELPKLAVTSDGGCYISWFDTRAGAYRVYMQRLNPQGIKQWGTNGILISANPQNTSLVDYEMAVDDSNYAVVVFTDIRNGGQIEPFAYRISPQGTFAWGANGVALSTSPSTFQANPKVVCTSDGNYVFAWIFSSTPRKVAMQKLNAAGVKQWGTDPVLISGTGTELLDYPSIVRSDNGNVILMMSGYTGSFLNPQNYHIYTQKYSPASAPLWGVNPDTVYALGRVSGFFVPRLIPDRNNGALYVWDDDRGGTNNSFSYVQHITSNDTKLFPANGASGSTLSGRLHNDAWASYTPLTGETFLFWYETDALFQSSYGVYGQKFSSSGTRQWADSGKAFRPFGGGQPSFIRSFGRDSSAVVFYLDGLTATNLVRGFKVDRNGNMLWGGTIKDVSSVPGGKGRLTGEILENGTSLLTWSDQRQDGNGVYAQDVNFDGTLGTFVPPPSPGWTSYTTGITNYLYSVKGVSQNVVWAAGIGGTVLRSVDHALTWRSVGGGAIGTADIYNIDAVDSNTAFVTTSPSVSYIYRTTNRGVLWTRVYTDSSAGAFIDGIHMLDATRGIAYGDPEGGRWVFLKTADGGATWVRTGTGPVQVGTEAGTQNGLSATDSLHIWFTTSGGRIYRSTDGGATWLTGVAPFSATSNVWFNNNQFGIVSSSTANAIGRSTDGGATWSNVPVGGSGFLIAVSGSGTTDFWYARGTTIYRSVDAGQTFAPSYVTTGSVVGLSFVTYGVHTSGWAGTTVGGIAGYYGSITLAGVPEGNRDVPQDFVLLQNYPNPFNPTTTIQFTVPAGSSGKTSLRVYDLLGREVATLVDEDLKGGTHSARFDASSVSSGVYFYRLTSGAFSATRKLLLLK